MYFRNIYFLLSLLALYIVKICLNRKFVLSYHDGRRALTLYILIYHLRFSARLYNPDAAFIYCMFLQLLNHLSLCLCIYAGDEIEYRWDGSRLLETVTEILLRVKRRINQCCCCDAYSLSTTSCIRYPNPFLPLTLSRRSRDSIRVHEQFFLEHPSTSSNYLTISGMRRYRYWLLTIDCINYWLMTVSTVFECFCVYIYCLRFTVSSQ